MSRERGRWLATGLLVLVAVSVCVLRWMIDRSLEGDLSLAWPDDAIARYRMTSILVGVVVGGGLGVAGLLLQVLLRNVLAEPFVLGLSSGAGFGVMAWLYLGHVSAFSAGAMLHGFGLTGSAALGSIGALAMVWLLGMRPRSGGLDASSLVLVGVIISTMCGAGIMLLQHLVPTGLRGEFTSWLMGMIPEVVDGRLLGLTGAIVAIGVILGVMWGGAMDAAMLGDDEARSVGVQLSRLRVGLFIVAGLLAAATVALAGPVGFVGLVSPHVARLIVGGRHRVLVAASAAVGVAFIVGADVVRQAIDLGAGRMPIGVLTAIVGGPVFLWLLVHRRGMTEGATS